MRQVWCARCSLKKKNTGRKSLQCQIVAELALFTRNSLGPIISHFSLHGSLIGRKTDLSLKAPSIRLLSFTSAKSIGYSGIWNKNPYCKRLIEGERESIHTWTLHGQHQNEKSRCQLMCFFFFNSKKNAESKSTGTGKPVFLNHTFWRDIG